jgi:serine/threonine protein kinase
MPHPDRTDSSPFYRPAPTIDGYRIDGELGRGGMGVVYRARQVRRNRPCALKIILAGAHADAVAASRFLKGQRGRCRISTKVRDSLSLQWRRAFSGINGE